MITSTIALATLLTLHPASQSDLRQEPPAPPVPPATLAAPVLAARAAPAAPVSFQVAVPAPAPASAALALPAPPAPVAPATYAVHAPHPLPPAAWVPQDPADSLWRAARRAINDGQYARAADLYFRLHQDARFRASEYRGQAYYWEAFARSRVGGRAELQRARAALEAMRTRHAEDWRAQRDAPALLARVNSELAQRGDARAAEEVQARGAAVARAGCDDAGMAVKVEAINALLQMDAAQAMPILEQVMKKRDACSAELRRKAVFLIAQKKTDRTEDVLLDAVRDDPDAEVRQQAVFWLSQVNTERSLAAIEQVLGSTRDAKLQEQAIFALSQHRSARATEALRNYALRDDLPTELRKKAIFWIGQRPGGQNVAFLKEIYPRLQPELKENIIFSIGQQGDESAAQWLLDLALNEREDLELRKHALFWVSQRRGVDVARLGQLYARMPSTEMKEQVIFVLSQRRDAAAVDRLMEIAKTEKDPSLRKRAIFWLGQSRDPRAARFLLDIINQ